MVKKVKKEKDLKGATKGKATGLIKKLAEEMLTLMGTKAGVEVSFDKENEAIIVAIKTEEEAGLLIGSRGVTLDSIQTILGLMYQKDVGEWQRIIVDVADWREKEEDRLVQLARQTAERVKTIGESQSLYNLNPSQRRIVHMSLSEDSEVKTESVGEGRNRYLVVSPRH